MTLSRADLYEWLEFDGSNLSIKSHDFWISKKLPTATKGLFCLVSFSFVISFANMESNNTITRNEALCFIYMLDFTPSNVRVCKDAIERAGVEICYQTDARFPILLPKSTCNKASVAGIVYKYPEELDNAPIV